MGAARVVVEDMVSLLSTALAFGRLEVLFEDEEDEEDEEVLLLCIFAIFFYFFCCFSDRGVDFFWETNFVLRPLYNLRLAANTGKK